jgi:hypothetical protein
MPFEHSHRLLPLALLLVSAVRVPFVIAAAADERVPAVVPAHGGDSIASLALEPKPPRLLPAAPPVAKPSPIETADFEKSVDLSERLTIGERLARRDAMTSAKREDSRPAERSRALRVDASQIGFVMLFAGLSLGALWLAFRDRHNDSAHVLSTRGAFHPAIAEFDLLEPLIANALPVVDESLPLPALARIHGRPVANLRYRFDAAHPVGDPHFAQESPTKSDEPMPIHWIPATRIAHPSTQQTGPSALERALVAVDRGLS